MEFPPYPRKLDMQRWDFLLSYFRIPSAGPALDQPGIETRPTAEKSETQHIKLTSLI